MAQWERISAGLGRRWDEDRTSYVVKHHHGDCVPYFSSTEMLVFIISWLKRGMSRR